MPTDLTSAFPAPQRRSSDHPITHLETVVPGWHDVEPQHDLDRLLQAGVAQITHGISPISLLLAGADWALHLAASPGKWHSLLLRAVRKQLRLTAYLTRMCSGNTCRPCIEALPQDQRFRHSSWQNWPYSAIEQNFLLHQQWWHHATTGVGGVSRHHQQVVSFMARQWLDLFSPSNFIATNPELQIASLREGGQNFIRGAINLLEDIDRQVHRLPPPGSEQFEPGKQVALTPGKVVFRNRLIELIQYSPRTGMVHAEPLLIVPAWIMKYYILDLSRHNSLVRYLVGQGHTVFMISWHNPQRADRDLGLEDYLRLGIAAACDAVRAIVPDRAINAVGYCLGGTLLAIAAAQVNHHDEPLFNSLTLLAAQTDFSEAGELTLFIDDSQVSYLENLMLQQGYLDTRQMAGAFQLLRSNDLLLSRLVQDYLLGRRAPVTDLTAWNADTTRMPSRMHSQYLRGLFLNNDLFAGRFKVAGRAVALSDIAVPIFAVATETDHVAPWRSVYKLKLIAGTELTFLLTNGGHNAGIVSEPGHQGRHYRSSCWHAGHRYIDPEQWFLDTEPVDGSWWPMWSAWLSGKNAAPRVPPPALGAPGLAPAPLEPAPGRYVYET